MLKWGALASAMPQSPS
ncbi:hypothetical protein MTR67_051429 [Solanum verrucosum]|uniref:Uncharacterized protein n=1 Tax=Solanum verrucosum TaxID=315347 RepID=A0AAF0V674_SOLVR|nr:hypothetical protein MTR67_051429 [Solanum verrucosum]